MNSSNKLKLQSWMVIAVVLAVAIGYPIVAFFPKMKAIAAVRTQIREKQDFAAQTEKLRATEKQQALEITAANDYIATQKSRLVEPAKLSQVFGRITQLAQQAGAQPTRFEPKPAVNYDTFRKVPLGLTLVGPTANIQEFLRLLETMPQRVWVDQLSLDAPSQTGEPVRGQLELVVFVDNPDISN